MDEAAILRVIVSLVFIVALILAGAWVTRRAGWSRSGAPRSLKVLASQNLGARAHVAIVQVEDARLVLGVTPNQISLLHTLPPADPANAAAIVADDATGFAAVLGKVLKGR